VSELCAVLQLPQSTVSRHLTTLADAAWVTSRRDGTSRYYSLAMDEGGASSPVAETAHAQIWQVTRREVADRAAAAQDTRRLERVLAQLRLYEHPLLNFSARAKGEGVEVVIRFKDESIPVHTYYFDLHPRDLEDAQFEWSFQRQLYDALHDYFVEMFIRTPQDRADRQRKGL
jgi:DNA-binding transcriptional ArsR family regulator